MRDAVPIRFLALDLDGTVLDGDRGLSPRTAAAVRAFAASGRELVVTTGRSRLSALPWVRALGGAAALVAHNGAAAYEGAAANGADGAPVHHRPLRGETARRLVALSRSLPIHFHAFSGEDWLYERVFPATERYALRSGFPGRKVDFDAMGGLEFSKGLFIGTEEEAEAAAGALRAAAIGGLECFRSSPGFLEVVAAGVSKASGLAAWLGLRGGAAAGGDPLAGVLAFGDAENDEDLLLRAGIGVAMGNADPALRARVGRSTCGVAEDGVAVWLEAFLEGGRRAAPPRD